MADDVGETIRAETAAMISAYERADAALDALDAVADPRVAFEQATAIAETLQKLSDRAWRRRSNVVDRIWASEEKMTYEVLAAKISRSTTRAYQLIRRLKAERLGPHPEDDDV